MVINLTISWLILTMFLVKIQRGWFNQEVLVNFPLKKETLIKKENNEPQIQFVKIHLLLFKN